MDLSACAPFFFCGVIPSPTKFRGGISQGGSQIAVPDIAPDPFDSDRAALPTAGGWNGKRRVKDRTEAASYSEVL